MTKWAITPGQLEQSFAKARRLRSELQRRERAIGRKAQDLAKGLADLMEVGAHLYRRNIGLHAFDANGFACLAAAYLEPEGDDFHYRYAVLCGGKAAKQALRTAFLDPGDSDEPGDSRRVSLASYDDHEDFIERLPAYLADITRMLEERIQRADAAETAMKQGRRQVSALIKRRGSGSPP